MLIPSLVALCLTLTSIAFADEAPAAAPASAALPLPAYFSGANPPGKTLWPDPTGANAGVWATPAGDGKGDVPSALAAGDIYDRVAHNMFSINMVWAMVTG